MRREWVDDMTEAWTPQVPPGETWNEQSQGVEAWADQGFVSATWTDQSQNASNWAIQYLPDNYVSPGYWEPGYTIGPYEWSTAEL